MLEPRATQEQLPRSGSFAEESRSDHITAARSAFRISIQIAIDEKLDQIIAFLEKEDMSCSIKDIEEFRSDQITKSC